jgi:hypothetical protein
VREREREKKKKRLLAFGANRLKRRCAYLFVMNLFSFSFFDGDFGFGQTTKKRKDIRRSTPAKRILYFLFSLFSNFLV